MKRVLKNSAKINFKLCLCVVSVTIGVLLSFSPKNISRSREMDKFIKVYNFVPFNIPRDGDGVGTIITFKKKSEAVIAGPNECFLLSKLSIDTLKGNLPDFEYVLSRDNDLEFNTGGIFGSKTSLSGALKDERVDSVKVSFRDVFEIRASRISVERSLNDMDKTCVKHALKKKNYFIERVLGVGGIDVQFYNKNGQTITIDGKILKEIKLDETFRRKFEGSRSLSFTEPRYIGYRLWDIDVEMGFANDQYVADSVGIYETLNLKLK